MPTNVATKRQRAGARRQEEPPLFSTLFAALTLENQSASGEKICKRRH
jgi:hypothetical protein